MMRRLILLASFLALATAVSAQQTYVYEFEVAGMSCDGCAGTATTALREIRGVKAANVTFSTKRGRVEATRDIGEEAIRAALAKNGFEARFPNDSIPAKLTAEERSVLDIKVASSGGAAFDVRQNLASGKFTIFDFWAEWCGPCHVLTPKLERLVQKHSNLALRTVDLKDWESPAGKQVTRDFKAPALPYVRVYAPDGTFLGEVLGNDIEKIKKLVGVK